ncbi:hypothetical protein ACLX1H_006769 [Fusarium chlamydosporum]
MPMKRSGTGSPDQGPSKKRGKSQCATVKIKLEAPRLEDFTKKYGIPKSQFAWGPREESPSEESFDEDETAPPPSIPNAYHKYPNTGKNTKFPLRRAPASLSRRRTIVNPSPEPADQPRPRPRPSGKSKSLLDMPAEIREEIYRGLLVSHKPIPVYDGWKRVYQREKPGLDISILMVCKKIFNEAVGVLYGENNFLYRLRDMPTRSQKVTNVQELAESNAYVPDEGPRETYTVVFGGEEIRAQAIHEPGTIDFKKYACLFRYITLQADHNRYKSYTQEFMADAIKIPRYINGNFTFVDWFESKSDLVIALKAVCCEVIRIKIWNKYLNDGIGCTSSELYLRAHQLRFFKHLAFQKRQKTNLKHNKPQGQRIVHKPDIWEGDKKMEKFRFERLRAISEKLSRLRPYVLKACNKHVQEDFKRRSDFGDEDDSEDEVDWDALFFNEASGSEAEDDVEDEFEAPSDDSEYED